MRNYVVIGAGQAGQVLAGRLRALDAEARITLIGDEDAPPYQRPPLSKKYLLGQMALPQLHLRPAAWYTDQRIDLRLGTPATAIVPAAQTVQVGAEVLPYDALALTTGSIPRRLPEGMGGALAGVYTVRSLADADRMAPEFVAGRRLLVVGGGYVGLEAAAVAARLGLTVTLVEAAPRILQRVASAQTADHIRALHQSEGVTVIEGVGLARLTGDAGRVTGAELADGRVIACDFAIVGIGIEPDVRLARAAGLAIDNGIAVDATCRTSDPAIWAAGDCASFPTPAGPARLESVGNAIDMAECAADGMAGQPRAYVPKPWFWSDQYDLKLQIAGLSAGHDRIVARPGAGGAMSLWYFAGDRLVAVDAMNDARAYMVAKRLIDAGRSADPDRVADPETDLKSLL